MRKYGKSAIILALLIFIMPVWAACTRLPLPGTNGWNIADGTTLPDEPKETIAEPPASSTTVPTAAPTSTSVLTPIPTPSPSPSPSPIPSPSPSPTSTPTPTPTLTPTPIPTSPPVSGNIDEAKILSLDNTTRGWWYRVPKPPFEDIPAGIDAPIQDLLDKYGAYWQAKPKPGKKTVYITMDEGYEYEENTTSILNTAREKGVKINFFITGHFLKSRPDLVKRMLAEGHLVGSHTYSHPSTPDLLAKKGVSAVVDDLRRLEKEYTALTGQNIAMWLRPPQGSYSEATLELWRQMGYKPVMWSFAYRDWEVNAQPKPKDAKERILGELHDGSILLIHAVSKTNAQILGSIIDGIRERGYSIELLSELP
ncbi:MAG: polysaccharide deacetylase family protein [Clostridiaceae bacterium]|nr:polysaccharide deacetylase family protein [Clostridiaceae bacterium]